MTKKTIVISLATLAVVAACAWLLLGGKKDQTTVDFERAKVERATLGNSVTATGTIEPVTEVEVGTQVSGIISRIYVDYNTVVHRGQVIAELDRTNLISELNSAKSQLASARSDLDYQRLNHERKRQLHEKGLISTDEYEVARLSFQQAQSTYAARQEAVQKAQTNLGYATITSPIDGVILSKSVEEGQTVAASFSTPTLFTIAQDLTDMRVIAKVDEADIGEVRQGQRVQFNVDAFPDETFQGLVTQVRQEGTTENNVVTYEVVISAPNNELKLKPGLTANVTIFTLEREGVLSVPTKALRFAPTPQAVGKAYRIEDCQAAHKLWTLEGRTLKAHAVGTGVVAGARTEILSGVSEGVEVVSDLHVAQPEADEAEQGERSPLMPGPPGKKK